MRLADGNPMTRTLSLTLIFEAIVFVLAIPGMIQVNDVAVGFAVGDVVDPGLCVEVHGGVSSSSSPTPWRRP